MKRFKPIVGISLLVQSITFLILCLVNIEKKKGLSAVFGIFSLIGGASGVALLVSDRIEQKDKEDELFDEDYYFDDFDEFDDEDGIDCNFAEEEKAGEEEDASEKSEA